MRGADSGRRFSVWFLLPVLLVIVFRFWTVSQLQESPLLAQPQLEDASYLSEARTLAQPLLGSPDRIPRGSALYTRIVAATLGEGDAGALPLVQVLVEALTTLLLTAWVARRFGRMAGVSAGVFYALDPLGGFFAARLIPTTWATLCFLAALIALEGARNDQTWTRSLGFGLLAALGFAFSPLLFALLVIIAVIDRFGRTALDSSPTAATRATPAPADSIGPRLSFTVAAVVPLLIVLSLTLARHDSFRGGGPTLSWGSGISIYEAASTDFGGTPRSLTRPTWRSAGSWQSEAWEARAREGTLYDLSRHYSSAGLRRWVEQPIETVGLLLVKTAATIGAWPIPDALSATFLFQESAPLLRYGAFSFALWLGLAVAGWSTLGSRSSRTGTLLLLGVIVVGVTCLLGTTSAAGRHPVLPLLAALSGIFLARALAPQGSEERPSPRAFGGLVLGLVLSLAAGFLSPTRAIDDRSEELRLVSNALAAKEDWAGATQAGEAAVLLAPDNVEARVGLARLYQRDGLVHASEEQLLAAYAADSTHVPTLLALAGNEQGRGNVERATVLVTRLVLQRPNNPLYLNELGQLYLRSQNVGQAKGLFLRALEIKPDYRVAQSNLETIVKYERDLERQLYPDEMQLPEGDPLTAQIQQVVGWMQEQNWSQADSVLKVAEAARPDHILPHFMRAGYHAQRGEDEEALASLELCRKLAPCRIAVVERVTAYYLAAGQGDRARELVDECLAGLGEDNSLARQWNTLRESLATAP